VRYGLNLDGSFANGESTIDPSKLKMKEDKKSFRFHKLRKLETIRSSQIKREKIYFERKKQPRLEINHISRYPLLSIET
jgi:hypothetical protein